jgi:mRNA-degrading endonuclease YafQ of YafQ-DinJ toxin-antitoxin module
MRNWRRIFYLQFVESATTRQSKAEHAEMKRLIALLRNMEPGDARYDDTPLHGVDT